MAFMAMLKEWLDLRDRENAEEDTRSILARSRDDARMAELEQAIDELVGGMRPGSGGIDIGG